VENKDIFDMNRYSWAKSKETEPGRVKDQTDKVLAKFEQFIRQEERRSDWKGIKRDYKWIIL
jgi:hypothetical protein